MHRDGSGGRSDASDQIRSGVWSDSCTLDANQMTPDREFGPIPVKSPPIPHCDYRYMYLCRHLFSYADNIIYL